MSEHIIDQPIRAIAAALRNGKTKPEDLIDEAVARHDAFGAGLDAYIHWAPEKARDAARAAGTLLAAGHDTGLLMGQPVAIKDLYGVTGMPIRAGTPKELPQSWQREGPVVAALRAQGAVITGKTHTVEFAFGGVGTNAHWDNPQNPWDPNAHRACGGSSSGAGVSLAQGSAVVAMGSDTGGSVRIPASVTGNVGLKVSIDRWSTDGIVPLSTTFDTPGPLTRSVEDAIIAFAAIDPDHDDGEALFQDLDGLDPTDISMAICDEHFWDNCSPGIAEGVKEALDQLTAQGARLTKLSFPEATQARDLVFDRHLFGVECLSFIEDEYPDRLETMDPNVRARCDISRTISGQEYYTALRKVRGLAAQAADRLRHFDVLVTPTLSITPPILDDITEAAAYNAANAAMTHNTLPGNMLEMCAVTMPVALDKAGMPVGLQLLASHGNEERLLAVALACEKILGTARQRLGVAPACRG